MIKEDTEKAANDFADREYEYNDIDRNALYKGFYWGAQWRINSVWHDVSEEPEVGKHCLLEVESIEDDERYIDYVSIVWSIYGWTEDYLELIERRSEGQYKITRWAYVEDLLPNKEK